MRDSCHQVLGDGVDKVCSIFQLITTWWRHFRGVWKETECEWRETFEARSWPSFGSFFNDMIIYMTQIIDFKTFCQQRCRHFIYPLSVPLFIQRFVSLFVFFFLFLPRYWFISSFFRCCDIVSKLLWSATNRKRKRETEKKDLTTWTSTSCFLLWFWFGTKRNLFEKKQGHMWVCI